MIIETRTKRAFYPDLRRAVRGNKNNLVCDGEWLIYNSRASDYDHDFNEALRGKALVEVVSSFPNTVVIDLMAPSGTLAEIFRDIPDVGKLGIAVSLEDIRSDREKERDKNLGIEQVAGDITKGSTWKKIERKLAGRKADLIIERAFGGLTCIPEDPIFYAYCLQRMWSFLNPNHGIMALTMLSTFKGVDPKVWVNKLREVGIAADIILPETSLHSSGTLLRIERAPHNPEFLPFDIVVDMSKKYSVYPFNSISVRGPDINVDSIQGYQIGGQSQLSPSAKANLITDFPRKDADLINPTSFKENIFHQINLLPRYSKNKGDYACFGRSDTDSRLTNGSGWPAGRQETAGSNLLLTNRRLSVCDNQPFAALCAPYNPEPAKDPPAQRNPGLKTTKSQWERDTRIELASLPWEGSILPVY